MTLENIKGNKSSFHLLGVHVISCSESHKMSIIHRGWNRHRSCTSSKRVAQLIRHLLQVVSGEFIIVMKHVIMCWSTCALRRKS
jgi:hypothetical protein